jgi:hypothetical protein
MNRELKGENVEKQSKENLENLTKFCQEFFEKIINQKSIDEMPREIRAICYFIAETGEKYKLNFTYVVLPLVSGFIMLRYLCPGIEDKIDVEGVSDGNIRGNLTTIAKVLQKLANGELFQVETPHLMPINKFIEKNRISFTTYLKELLIDPQKQEEKQPYEDICKTVEYQEIQNKRFNQEDLTFLHELVYVYGFELIVSLQKEISLIDNKKPISEGSLETNFINLMHSLGPPKDQKENKQIEELKEKIEKISKNSREEELRLKEEEEEEELNEEVERELLLMNQLKEFKKTPERKYWNIFFIIISTFFITVATILGLIYKIKHKEREFWHCQ